MRVHPSPPPSSLRDRRDRHPGYPGAIERVSAKTAGRFAAAQYRAALRRELPVSLVAGASHQAKSGSSDDSGSDRDDIRTFLGYATSYGRGYTPIDRCRFYFLCGLHRKD